MPKSCVILDAFDAMGKVVRLPNDAVGLNLFQTWECYEYTY